MAAATGGLSLALVLLAPHAVADAQPLSPPPPADPKQLLDAADEIARKVAELRDIPAKGRIERALVGQVEARRRVEALLRKQYGADEIVTEGLMLERLGFLPPGSDYAALTLDLLTRQLAGFYDPGARKLFVADWLGIDMQRPALAHEICHALQDQRFDLGKLIGPARGESDRQLARHALAEGDATALMLEFLDPSGAVFSSRLLGALMQQLMRSALDEQSGTPAYLRETMMFSYADGLAFVARIRQRHPWSAVDAVWRRPPESTEQVLHPEKYEKREVPVPIQATLLPALFATHRLASVDTLGELVIRVWLAQGNDRRAAERAAAGWGGDRIAVYLPGRVTGVPAEPRSATLAWLTTWDSDADAADFATTARTTLATLAGASPTAALPFTDGRGLIYTLERSGTSVALVLGASKGAAGATEEILKTWKPGKPAPR